MQFGRRKDYPKAKENRHELSKEELDELKDAQRKFRENWPEYDRARRELKIALTKQFNTIYASDVNSLHSWGQLCQILEIVPVPETLQSRREAVKDTHVNLVDLVDTRSTSQRVRVFRTELHLSIYTKATDRFFPKRSAYAGGLLLFLLRNIMYPDRSKTRHCSGR
ncbi:hypothetical protein JAAARDRAFT_137311 [Jaapia argillacea MUCL 33604]|uniref:Uncharacterized protein n=1 Tax=Jaapia argillacea MUCL 33604 TaxID=933084 RepID=A0A067PEN4_9AGAM|nr:hypothetical protein JAAARDRAFT_137311 [Jaapia argillacea MUCL 33604]